MGSSNQGQNQKIIQKQHNRKTDERVFLFLFLTVFLINLKIFYEIKI